MNSIVPSVVNKNSALISYGKQVEWLQDEVAAIRNLMNISSVEMWDITKEVAHWNEDRNGMKATV